MILKTIFCAVVAALALAAAAQERKPGRIPTVEEQQAMADRAYQQAMERAAQERARQAAAPVTAPLLQPEALRRQAGTADPGDIAARYENFRKANLPPVEDVLVFVSTSIPMPTLVRLGQQAKAAGAVLVFRGITGEIGKPRAIARWVSTLKPLTDTGAGVQINPKLFDEYRVAAVPSFAIASRTEGCGAAEVCQPVTSVLQGDVSLDYALEHWAAQGGRVGGIAQARLNRMYPAGR